METLIKMKEINKMLIQLLYDTENRVLVRYSGQRRFKPSQLSDMQSLSEMHPQLVKVANITGFDISFNPQDIASPVKIFSYNDWRSEIAFQKKMKKNVNIKS